MFLTVFGEINTDFLFNWQPVLHFSTQASLLLVRHLTYGGECGQPWSSPVPEEEFKHRFSRFGIWRKLLPPCCRPRLLSKQR